MNPSVYGQSIKLTATVTSQASTGSVTFYDGTIVLGMATLANGSATLTTQLLASGVRSLYARYDGDFTHLGSVSPKLAQTVNSLPSSGFQPTANYGASAVPWTVVVADFNGDGNLDLAVTNQGGPDLTAGSISVFLGNGDGTFQSAQNVATTPSPRSLVTGDFNGDGIADLAYSGFDPTQFIAPMNVLLGNGDGTFRASGSYLGAGSGIYATGDFNDDGYTDIADVSGGVAPFLGNGDGTFRFTAISSLGQLGGTSGVVGDFNRDGRADVALTTGGDKITVLFGDGKGDFELSEVFFTATTTQNLISLAVGDLNGDGYLDLVAGSHSNSGAPANINVLFGKGDGTFQTAVAYTAGKSPQSIAVGDFNGDGRIDLALVNSGSDNVGILLGVVATGQTIGFSTPESVALGTQPFTVIATASSGLTVGLTARTPAVCTVSGATVTTLSVGICTIIATQSGNSTYAAAAPVIKSFAVGEAQTITFGALSNRTLGTAPFPVRATASSGLKVTYASNSTSVCTVSGTTVTLLETGVCSITASQSGNPTWAAAASVTQTFTVH